MKRRAFERIVRAEGKTTNGAQMKALFKERCAPSLRGLRLVGPCHTVSLLLNIQSLLG